MKGLKQFLAEAWPVFGLAALMTIVMAWLTGWWFYLAFLPVLIVIALYMSAVRYDSDGKHRGEDR